jgi:hypothetical protein
MIKRLYKDEKTSAKKLAREILVEHLISLEYWTEKHDDLEKMTDKEIAMVDAEINKIAREIFLKYSL